MLVKTSLVWQLSHSICIKVLHLKWSCVFDSIAWWNNCSLTRISFPHIYCTPNLYPFKDLISISYFMFARAYFLENEIFTKNANFLLLIWQNCQLIMIVIVPYIYIMTLVNPLYFLFLWFLWYIALDFVHLSILWSSYIVSMLSGM